MKAVTWNTAPGTGPDGRLHHGADADMNMYVCNSFWSSRTLDDAINKFKDDQNYVWKHNIQSYMNRGVSYAPYSSKKHQCPWLFAHILTHLPHPTGSIILHELMHGDKVSYAANNNEWIPDLKMKIWEYKYDDPDDEGKGNYTREKVTIDVYGAENVKLMAHTDWRKIGKFTSGNGQSSPRCHCTAVERYMLIRCSRHLFILCSCQICSKEDWWVSNEAAPCDPR